MSIGETDSTKIYLEDECWCWLGQAAHGDHGTWTVLQELGSWVQLTHLERWNHQIELLEESLRVWSSVAPSDIKSADRENWSRLQAISESGQTADV